MASQALKPNVPETVLEHQRPPERGHDFIVYGCRLFIPSSLRPTILSRLHEAYQGISRSQLRACLTLYWSNIDQDIENFLCGCRHCQDNLTSQLKEPIMPKSVPQRPFQQIAMDFCIICRTPLPDS